MKNYFLSLMVLVVLAIVGCSHANPLDKLTSQQFHRLVIAINSATQNDMTCGNYFAGRLHVPADARLKSRCQAYAKAGVAWLATHQQLSITPAQFTSKERWQRYLTWLYHQQALAPTQG